MGTESLETVLILEDEFLIAMDLEALLNEHGFDSIEVVPSCAEAHRWLEQHTPLIAIIDVALRDGSCSAVAKILIERNVPFIVSSGSDSEYIEPIFHMGEWIPKPSDQEHIIRSMQELRVSNR